MTKLDWDIAEHNRILDEMQHRTEVENQAFGLMAEGKFLEAKELVETLDDSLLEFRAWPGEESVENDKKDVTIRVKIKVDTTELDKAIRKTKKLTKKLAKIEGKTSGLSKLTILPGTGSHAGVTTILNKILLNIKLNKIRVFCAKTTFRMVSSAR